MDIDIDMHMYTSAQKQQPRTDCVDARHAAERHGCRGPEDGACACSDERGGESPRDANQRPANHRANANLQVPVALCPRNLLLPLRLNLIGTARQRRQRREREVERGREREREVERGRERERERESVCMCVCGSGC